MLANRAIRSYRTVAVDSASPTRLLDDLLARLLADCRGARERLAARDVAAKGALLGHALAIVGELAAALDHETAPELTANLVALYDFVGSRLTTGNLRCDPAPIREAELVIEGLRDAFAAAAAAGTAP